MKLSKADFATTFQHLTGNLPFPWQSALYERFIDPAKGIPASCNLPTGLGKTSVIAVWLIALANGAKVPRRLVYVVNRRTVVDQTTEEVEKYRDNLEKAGLWNLLAKLSATPATKDNPPLALSTLRGQFADNREWSADPSRPAVICGTVDMIGSRLLFSGYGVGWKSKPLHAGFLGQDALLVHDEAHLEPAFQELIESIEREQKRCKEFGTFKVMALTATSRSGGDVFELTKEEKEAPTPLPPQPTTDAEKKRTLPIHHVWWRTHSRKAIEFHEIADEKTGLVPKIVERAMRHNDDPAKPAVLIFVRTVLAVDDVVKKLKAGGIDEKNIETLTGTMRGLERERMATASKVFKRFKKDSPAEPQSGTVYLVCTSAGEVGVDMSADHMVCDLSTYDSMAQRFGRVNRFGTCPDTVVHVVHSTEFEDKPYDVARKKTLSLLEAIPPIVPFLPSVSPEALAALDPSARQDAFAPPPTILPATDILFDAWALTTITDKLPGRPKLEPYLHGITDWQPPETHVAWREEVAEITGDLLKEYKPKELLEDYPLRPHELLREPSYRTFKHLEAMAKRLAGKDVPVWLVDDDGSVEVLTLKELADKDNKERINGMTVLLPPSAGGLSGGMLDGTWPTADDVADEWFVKDRDGKPVRQRKRLRNADPEDNPEVAEMHSIRTIEYPGADDDAEEKTWEWFVLRNEGEKSAKDPVTWAVHVGDVVTRAKAIVANLPLSEELKKAVVTAAEFHDHGKRRKLFQTILGNTRWPKLVLAKSGKKGGRVTEKYRHEFGSLVDIARDGERENLLKSVELLDDDGKELVLHLIAAHHGRGRPHFPADESFDPDGHTAICERIAREVPRRFARLQRKYGRWGLAYLESLLRAADWAASGNPSAYLTKEEPK